MNYRRVFVENSFVFITIVTSKRRNILIKNIDILRNSLKRTVQTHNYEICAICVLQDHLHMIIKPYNINDYPKIIQQIKRYFSQKIDKKSLCDYELSKSNMHKKECDVWQHRYWEHTIINQEDLNRHIDYIHYNPYKHYKIAPREWQYSSFKKFVEQGFYEDNWCNFGDVNNIELLNYE